MQKLWFVGPIWYKGKIIKSPDKVPAPFRKKPEETPYKVSGRIASTETWLKFKTEYQ